MTEETAAFFRYAAEVLPAASVPEKAGRRSVLQKIFGHTVDGKPYREYNTYKKLSVTGRHKEENYELGKHLDFGDELGDQHRY